MHWTRDHADVLVGVRASGRWATAWPRIVTASRATRRERTTQRRQTRAHARNAVPVPSVAPTAALPEPPPLPVSPIRPKLVVNGTPTATHPCKRPLIIRSTEK